MMKIDTNIAHAAECLKAGQLVAMPTETVYGLAANACDDMAIERVYAAKGRPSHNPLIIHVAHTKMAQTLVEWNEAAELLSHTYWPGPLTMVLKRRAGCPISKLASAGLETLAIRVPAHPIAQQLLAACALPLAAPSANLSGCVTATSAQHVAADFAGKDVTILEAGPTTIGLESTVIDITHDTPQLLRPGSITHHQLEATLGTPVMRMGDNNISPASPGMLTSHYAPKAKLRLNATHVEDEEALLAFGKPLEGAVTTINLSEQGDIAEASSHLFAALRDMDAKGATHIAVMPIPNEGIGEALNDRLQRAAAPKQS